MVKACYIFILTLFTAVLYSNQLPCYLNYLDPIPDSKFVNTTAPVLIKPSGLQAFSGLFNAGAVTITGSISGLHEIACIRSVDGNTIILKPVVPFSLGEKVTVSFFTGGSNQGYKPFAYEFQVKQHDLSSTPVRPFMNEINNVGAFHQSRMLDQNDNVSSVPSITINYSSGPTGGFVFLSDFSSNPANPVDPYLLIVRNNGQLYYSRDMNGHKCYNLNLQPNNNLTYYDGVSAKYFELDTGYTLIDSISCGNGYATDVHELRFLANGHYLILSYDPEVVDMSHVILGGNSNATVIGLIIQELDQNKNVVFQWRSWDHFQITDATHEDLTASSIDYVHGNALEYDNDGNIILSSRHMDEITKINRATGEIMWRFGGKNNQFTFIDDPESGFSHQHAIRRINNGNLTMFDNGNFHTPPHSRALEYQVDEVNKTARLVWSYRNNPDIYGSAMGYVQRLVNGNTLIGWGFTNPSVTEVKPDGTRIFEMDLPNGAYSYRAYRYDWKEPSQQNVIPVSFALSQNYPNPFNPATNIKVDIPATAGNLPVAVKLTVYDLLGNEVVKLVNSDLVPGSYTIRWNALGYASGVYLYKLTAGNFVSTKKMMLIK